MKLADSMRTVHSLGLEDLSSAVRYRRYLFELVEPHLGDSVLEVGAGLGDFAAQLTGRRRLVVTDSDPFCMSSLRERLGDRPEVEVETLDVRALGTLRSLVVPGGNLVLLVPGYPSLYGRFDRVVGHRRRYTPATLRRAVDAAELDVEVLKPVNLPGALAWWAAVRMGRRTRPTPILVSLYDRFVVPLVCVLERRFEPPFGQSLLCVARAPAD
jgi:hypothetical protein